MDKPHLDAPYNRHLIAYHCGHRQTGGSFSARFLGTGEGWGVPPLGPGFYFSDDPDIARAYCKYSKDPVLQKVRLDMRNVLWKGSPVDEKQRRRLEELKSKFAQVRWGKLQKAINPVAELPSMLPIRQARINARKWSLFREGYDKEMMRLDSEVRNMPTGSARETKLDEISQLTMQRMKNDKLVEGMGPIAANQLLVKMGIAGYATRIPAGLEIAIYDPSHIETLESASQRSGKNPTKKPAKPDWQRQISKCQKLWDHYCERPGKTRLQAVFKHIETMKTSASKKVAAERGRCLRAANLEAKRLGMK